MCPLAMGTGVGAQGREGQGLRKKAAGVFRTLVPPLRAYPELRPPAPAPRDEVEVPTTSTQVPGSVIPLPSAGFALEHRRIAFLVSRLPSPVSSGLSFRSFGFFLRACVYVPLPEYLRLRTHAYMRRCNTSRGHRTDKFDPSRRDAATTTMGAPTHMGLDVPGVAPSPPPPPASLVWPNNTYISRSLANTLSSSRVILLVFMTIHTGNQQSYSSLLL